MIKLTNVMKEYEKFNIGPLNLKFIENEFISLIGPSGSGKSTLVQLLTKNLEPDQGKVQYRNIRKEEILYISQNGTTFNHLTIRENLNLKTIYDDQTLICALRKVYLEKDLLTKYPNELSGGQRQRLDLVRAILSKCKFIILDESMSALDSENKNKITKLLLELIVKNNISILYITHDLEQAQKYSTKIIKMHKGKIIKEENL